MTYEFVIHYETGEREVGTTTAFSLEEAIRNIVDIDDVDEIDSITFNYTLRHSSTFENEDILKFLK